MTTLRDLANYLGAEIHGDEHLDISGIASLDNIQAGKIVFITKENMLARVNDVKPTALITRSAWLPETGISCLLVDNPYEAYAKLSHLYSRKALSDNGIHPKAVISESAVIGQNVCIGPGAVIEDHVVLADDVVIGPNSVIGHSSRIGTATRIAANVTIYHDVVVGEYCEINSGTVIGGDGFGFAPTASGWLAIEQNGGVIIGNRVDIGCSSTIDCGAIEPTILHDGVIIDNQVHIAHNVEIGENTAIAGCCGIAGSTKIGKNCVLAGATVVNGHIEICDNVQINGHSRVTKSIFEAGTYCSGTPLMEHKLWRKAAVNFARSVKKKS